MSDPQAITAAEAAELRAALKAAQELNKKMQEDMKAQAARVSALEKSQYAGGGRDPKVKPTEAESRRLKLAMTRRSKG